MAYNYDAAPTDPHHGGKLTAEQAAVRIAELEAATNECRDQLMGMSMGTEGYQRNLIFRASNVLSKVLGKQTSSHGSDEYFESYKL